MQLSRKNRFARRGGDCIGRSRHRALNLELLERREYLAADLIITELMASNDTTLVDEDINSPDWIEVHNPTDQPVNLLGWSLTDDPATPDKWRFPNQEIAPNEYLVVFASGKDRAYDTEALRRDF
ncbi:MAG: lamin tail domain-containing protein, partial [Pirellulaceae bacterium]